MSTTVTCTKCEAKFCVALPAEAINRDKVLCFRCDWIYEEHRRGGEGGGGAVEAEPRVEASPLPPWTLFRDCDGTCDVLAAGRPGVLLHRLPEVLARDIVNVANAWRSANAAKSISDATKALDALAKNLAPKRG